MAQLGAEPAIEEMYESEADARFGSIIREDGNVDWNRFARLHDFRFLGEPALQAYSDAVAKVFDRTVEEMVSRNILTRSPGGYEVCLDFGYPSDKRGRCMPYIGPFLRLRGEERAYFSSPYHAKSYAGALCDVMGIDKEKIRIHKI
jgi:hypothetical protein